MESLFDALERRRIIRLRVVWLLLLGLPALSGVSALLPDSSPVYRAEAKVRLVRGGGSGRVKKRDFGDESALIHSARFASTVLSGLTAEERQVLLRQRSGMKSKSLAGGGGKGGDGEGSWLLGRVSVERFEDTSLMTVAAEDRNPRVAAALVNATIRAAQRQGEDRALRRTERLQSFFAPRVAELKAKIDAQEEQERQLAAASSEPLMFGAAGDVEQDYLDPIGRGQSGARRRLLAQSVGKQQPAEQPAERRASTGDARVDDTVLDQIVDAARQARLDLRLARAELNLDRTLGHGIPAALDVDDTGQDHTESSLRTQLAQAESVYASMAEELGANHPEVEKHRALIGAIRKQLEALDQAGVERARVRVAVADRESQALDRGVRADQSKVLAGVMARQQAAFLEANLAVNLTLAADLARSLANVPTRAVLNALTLEVVSPAYPPLEPVHESRIRPMARRTLGGLLLAFLAIVTLYFLQGSQWTLAEVENAAAAPVVAVIPKASATAQSGSTGSGEEEVRGGVREPLESLRVLLPLLRTTQGNAILLFTGTVPGEGTTTLAAEFARTLARGGNPVLLIDANPFRPGCGAYFGLPETAGLTSVLYGGASLERVVQTVPREGGQGEPLHVLASGPRVPDPVRGLHSPAMQDLLIEARAAYRYVVLDAAPSSVSGGILHGNPVDLVFLVARMGVVRADQVRKGRARLVQAGMRPRGVLVNAVRPGRRSRPVRA